MSLVFPSHSQSKRACVFSGQKCQSLLLYGQYMNLLGAYFLQFDASVFRDLFERVTGFSSLIPGTLGSVA